LSVPAVLKDSSLNTPDSASFASTAIPGAPAVDAPVSGPRGEWLLDYLDQGFTLLAFGTTIPGDAVTALARAAIPVAVVQVGGAAAGAGCIEDREKLLEARYDAQPGTCYLFRPDEHVCARWRSFDLARVIAAVAHATGQTTLAEQEAA